MSINSREDFIAALIAELAEDSGASQTGKLDYKSLDASKVFKPKEFKAKTLTDLEVFRKLNFDFPLIEDSHLSTLLASLKTYSSLKSTSSNVFNSFFCFTEKFSENLSQLCSASTSSSGVSQEKADGSINLSLISNEQPHKVNKSRRELIGEIYCSIYTLAPQKVLNSSLSTAKRFFSSSTNLVFQDSVPLIPNPEEVVLSSSFEEGREEWMKLFNSFLSFSNAIPSSSLFFLGKGKPQSKEEDAEIRDGCEENNQYLTSLLSLLKKFLPFVLFDFHPELLQEALEDHMGEISLYGFLLHEAGILSKKKNLLRASQSSFDDIFDTMFDDKQSPEKEIITEAQEGETGLDYTLVNFSKLIWSRWVDLFVDLLCLYPDAITNFLPVFLDLLLKPLSKATSVRLSLSTKGRPDEIHPSYYFSLAALSEISGYLSQKMETLRALSYNNNNKLSTSYLALSMARLKVRDYLLSNPHSLLDNLYQVISLIEKNNKKRLSEAQLSREASSQLPLETKKNRSRVDLEASFFLLDLAELLVYRDNNPSVAIQLKNLEASSVLISPNFIFYSLLTTYGLLLSQYVYLAEGAVQESLNVCVVEEGNTPYYWQLSSRLSSFFTTIAMYSPHASDALINFMPFSSKTMHLIDLLKRTYQSSNSDETVEIGWFSPSLLYPLILSLYITNLATDTVQSTPPLLSLENLGVLRETILTKYQFKSIVIPDLKDRSNLNRSALLTCLSHSDYKRITQSITELKDLTPVSLHQDLLAMLNKTILFTHVLENKNAMRRIKADLTQFFKSLGKSLNFFKIQFNLILSLTQTGDEVDEPESLSDSESGTSHAVHASNSIRDLRNSVQLFSGSITRIKALAGLWEENTSNKAD